MKKIYYLLLLLSLAFYSCEDPEDLVKDKKITDKTFNMEFIEVLNTNSRFQHKFETRNTFVIKTKAEENDLFSNHLFDMTMPPTSALPDVDYDKKMLLCIVYPMQSSGSNKLSITNVKMVEGIIEVSSELFVPGIGTDDIGMPVVFVEVDKYDNEVNFLATKEIFGATSNDDLLEKTWKLKYTKNPNGTKTEPEFYMEADSQWQRVFLSPFTIFFANDHYVNGKANCNTWEGQYSINGNDIEFKDMSSTEAACPYSDKYQSLLLNAKTINYTADSVYIESEINNEKYTLVFYHYIPQIENLIPRTAWRFSSWSEDGGITFNGGYFENGNFVDLQEHKWTLNFDNGIATGVAGCENFETIYTIDAVNSNIGFNNIKSDGSDCYFNKTYIELIKNSSSYEMKLGNLNMLTLYDAQKKIILRFYNDFTVQYRWLGLDATFELLNTGTIDYANNVSNLTNVVDKQFTLKTNPDYSFTGKGECNNFTGNFINYNNMGETNASLVATKIACSDFEQNYFNCFNATTHFRWENELLILFNYEEGKEFNYLVFQIKI